MGVRGRWVGLAVATAVLVGAGGFVLLRPRYDGPGTLALTATGPMSIWPESPFDPEDTLRREQALVDGGRDAWRRDAREVVARFAKAVFGWPEIGVSHGDESPARGPATLSIQYDCGAPCSSGDGGVIDVTVDRLLRDRPGGVWSVVAVSSPRLRLPVEAGDTLAAGDRLSIGLNLAGDEHAAVGLRYVQRIRGAGLLDCGDGFSGEVDVTGTNAEVTVPDPLYEDAGCMSAVGYVFAYMTPTLTVQTGDPLLEPGAVGDLSIVPVRFSQEAVGSTPAPGS